MSESDYLYTALRQWLTTPIGRKVLMSESQCLQDLLPNLRGYHFALMGEPTFTGCLANLGISHQLWLHPYAQASGRLSIVACHEDQVPLQAESVDAVFLAHCLERVADPQAVLREAYRILSPEGYLIISGFNPWSLWGAWFKSRAWFDNDPWSMELLPIWRVHNWLQTLGFEDIQSQAYLYYPPGDKSEALLQKMAWMEGLGRRYLPWLGGAYAILAQKQVFTLTPIKPGWRLSEELISPILEPTSGQICHVASG